MILPPYDYIIHLIQKNARKIQKNFKKFTKNIFSYLKLILEFGKIYIRKEIIHMKMNEKKKYFLKKIALVFLFLVFWILLLIHIFKTEGSKELALTIFYLLLFLPITVTILLDYEVFSLFIIILYEIAMLLMGIIMLSIGLANKELSFLTGACLGVQALFAMFMIGCAIQFLRNKSHALKIACLVTGIANVSLIITSFILNGEFTFDTYYDFIRNLAIVLIFLIYIVTFPYVQLKIFKDEK